MGTLASEIVVAPRVNLKSLKSTGLLPLIFCSGSLNVTVTMPAFVPRGESMMAIVPVGAASGPFVQMSCDATLNWPVAGPTALPASSVIEPSASSERM